MPISLIIECENKALGYFGFSPFTGMDFAVDVASTEGSPVCTTAAAKRRVRTPEAWERENSMDCFTALGKKKEVLLEKWFQAVADTYPEETSRFLRDRADRFANPVGHALRSGLAGLLAGLLEGAGEKDLAPHLDEIVRIRAVQEFSPSQAVDFVFAFRRIARETIGAEVDDLGELDGRIDGLALLAFDNYMACRERLFEIKVKELRDMVAIQTRSMWKAAAGKGGATVPREEPSGGQ